MADHDPVFDDENDPNADDFDPEEASELIADNLEYVASVVGRQLGDWSRMYQDSTLISSNLSKVYLLTTKTSTTRVMFEEAL